MRFSELVDQAMEFLRQRERVSYRALKREFDLDDESLEDLRAELIDAQRIAADEDGKVLVWTGAAPVSGSTFQVSGSQSPAPSPQTLDSSRLRTPNSELISGERRQLTVQFIDLVGSTTLSQQLDPEDYHGRVVAYQAACRQVIARYEGHIAQYLGDGVLVYFGYPTAHDEDAVRAVRSGLEVVAAVSQLEFTPPLQVRIGIHTGPVVVGEIGAGERTERLALGDAPNIAARVQGKAEPNTVCISQATYRLVQGIFTCEALGPQALKNVAVPLELYRVQGAGAAQSRFEAAVHQGLTPLVGRDLEVGLLRERWMQAKGGAGQVVLLSGEPGIGKSRLVQELKDQLEHAGVTRIEFRCSPYHQNSALYPIIDHLQRLLQFTRDDAPAVKLEKLQHTLSPYRFPQSDTVSLLAALLSLPHPEGYPPITVSPQKQKEKTHAAVVAWLVEEAEQNTVYTTWEDVHWADPSTLEVLTLFLDQVPTTRLLALLTFRPEFMPPWGNRSHLSQITLSRLGRRQVETMVEKVTGGKTLPSEVLQQIVAKTDGVPLFVEELTKTVLESVESIESMGSVGSRNRTSLQEFSIPATLQDSLMARLDRLGPVREIAQLGATIGREFSYELLLAVSSLDEATLQHGLKRLVEAELVYQRGLVPQAHYLFKHALIQDTAYQSLLKSTRQQSHRQIAHVLAERFPETVETQPELVAHHYTEAGLIEQALPYWQKAGERATQRSAYVEAIGHLTKGLALLKTLPDTPERIQRELTLQNILGVPLRAIKGYADPEVERTYKRALELCQQIGETPQLFPALYGLFGFYIVGAKHKTAHELAEQLLSVAQRQQDPALLLEAHRALGQSSLHRGEFVRACSHFEEGVALYDPQQHGSHVFAYAGDPRVVCLDSASIALWQLGYPDQAVQKSHEAITLAQEVSHPFSLAHALWFAAMLHQHRRDGQAAQEQAEILIALCNEQGFAFWLVGGTIFQGWALAGQGQGEEGIAQIRQGIVAWRATGAGRFRHYFLALLAEVCGQTDKAEEGLALLAEAVTVAQEDGDYLYEPELYRLQGELTLAQSSVQSLASSVQEEAEECFLKAIEVARKQQAKSLELRAGMSVSRLWQSQGKKDEARKLLAEIYGWFTEGFDTKDLQEAKAMIEELSH